MKKACIVRHRYYPADPRVRKEAEALIDEGYKVDVICLKNIDEKSRENVYGVNVYRLPLRHYRRSMARYIFEYLTFFGLASAKLCILYFQNNYEVVQVNTLPDFLVFVAVIPKLFGAKVMLDMHEPAPELWCTKYGVGKMKFIIRALKWFEQISIRFADHVITVTEQLKDTYVSRGASSSKITVVLNGADNKIFNPTLYQSNFQSKNDNFTLISHGTIEKRYWLDGPIKAVNLLKGKISNIQLNILGEGEYLPELKKLVTRLKLGNFVHFLGFVSFDEMLKMIIKSDVGIVPLEKNAYSDLVHTNKMFEYIAMRKPTIITRTKAVEAYFDDSCLMFFESGNEEDLAKCILELYKNPEKREDLVKNAWKRNQKIRWSENKKTYCNIFAQLLQRQEK